jgi:hypothetical protein
MKSDSPHDVRVSLFGFDFTVNLLTSEVFCIEPDGSLGRLGFFTGRGLILELAHQQQSSN